MDSFINFFSSIFEIIGNNAGVMFGVFGALGTLVAYGIYKLVQWIMTMFP